MNNKGAGWRFWLPVYSYLLFLIHHSSFVISIGGGRIVGLAVSAALRVGGDSRSDRDRDSRGRHLCPAALAGKDARIGVGSRFGPGGRDCLLGGASDHRRLRLDGTGPGA